MKSKLFWGFLLFAQAGTNLLRAQEYTFSTLAGPLGGLGYADGPGPIARFKYAGGVAAGPDANVYVADGLNQVIRKITPNGVVTTFAGLAGHPGCADGKGSAARFAYPARIAVDAATNIYVTDNVTVRKISPEGDVTTLAGLAGSPGSVDGRGNAARFRSPIGIAADNAGNLFIADSFNQTIRKITPEGTVTTLAGLAGTFGAANGTGEDARFNYPEGVATDTAGNVYVADTFNFLIRKITPTGVVTTLAGALDSPGGGDGTGSNAHFHTPQGLTVDKQGNIYVADSYNNAIRKITPARVVSTFAGIADLLNRGSNDGIAGTARFETPTAVTIDSAGNLYVADSANSTIRKITPARVVTTLAGAASSSGGANGPAHAARFSDPAGVAVDATGTVFVSEWINSDIRKITPDGTVSTFAGIPWNTSLSNFGYKNGAGSAARFDHPRGIAFDQSGNLFVADQDNNVIREITPQGEVSTFVGQPPDGTRPPSGYADGPGPTARFSSPTGLGIDRNGTLYVGDSNNHVIRKITPDQVVTTFAGLAGQQGSDDGIGSAARFSSPGGVAVDTAGNIYVADKGNFIIRKITPEGAVTTLAVTAKSAGTPNQSPDGLAAAARFGFPTDLALDSLGNLYVTDGGYGTIRMITPQGLVSTIGGLRGDFGSSDGRGIYAKFGGTDGLFSGPSGIAVDSAGRLYIADTTNQKIRFAIPLAIVQEPVNQTLFVSEAAQFGVEPSSLLPVSYQWRFNQADLPNETNAVLRLPSATVNQSGDYSIVLANAAGWVTSRVATLNVVAGAFSLKIVTQPQNQVANPGATLTFTVEATGNPPPAYQWRRNGENILGATQPTLSVPNAQPPDGGRYSVVVSNFRGTLTSQFADLVVTSPSLSFTDDFADRVILDTPSGVGSGNNRTATREPGEPNHAAKRGARSLWLGWRAPGSGIATFSTLGSSFDTLLAVYTGAALSSLMELASDDDGSGFLTSEVKFNAQQGTEYIIAVDGFSGASGDVVLNWSLDTTISDLPRFVLQPLSQTVAPGGSASFKVIVTSQAAETYQWFCNCVAVDTSNPTSTKATLLLDGPQTEKVGLYSVRVSNAAGRIAESKSALLETGPPAVKVQSQDKYADLIAERGGTANLQARTAGFPIVTAGVLGSQNINNFNSTTEQDEPSNPDYPPMGSSRWYEITAADAGTLVIDTIGSDINTFLAVYAPPAGADLSELPNYIVGQDDNGAPDGIRSLLRLNASKGTTYLIYVAGINSEQGDITLNWGLGQTPVIALPPSNQSVRIGGTLLLNATATGIPAPTYRWFLNDGLVANAAGLKYEPFQAGTAGRYRVVVENGIGVAMAEAIITAKDPLRLGDDGVPKILRGTFRLPVTGAASGHIIIIEASSDLFHWNGIWTNQTENPLNFFDRGTDPSRFYRAVEQ